MTTTTTSPAPTRRQDLADLLAQARAAGRPDLDEQLRAASAALEQADAACTAAWAAVQAARGASDNAVRDLEAELRQLLTDADRESVRGWQDRLLHDQREIEKAARQGPLTPPAREYWCRLLCELRAVADLALEADVAGAVARRAEALGPAPAPLNREWPGVALPASHF